MVYDGDWCPEGILFVSCGFTAFLNQWEGLQTGLSVFFLQHQEQKAGTQKNGQPASMDIWEVQLILFGGVSLNKLFDSKYVTIVTMLIDFQIIYFPEPTFVLQCSNWNTRVRFTFIGFSTAYQLVFWWIKYIVFMMI